MSGKKIEIIGEKKKKMITFFGAIVLFLVLFAVFFYYVLDKKTIDLLHFVIGLVGVPTITFLFSMFVSEIRERIERWKLWSNPNFKWYIIVIGLIDIVLFLFLIFKKTPTQGDKPGKTPLQELYNDSIAAINRQTWFEDKFKEFDSFLKKPLNDVAKNSQIISDGFSILCQLCDTLIKYPEEFSDKPLGKYINEYNSRVDEAQQFARAAYRNRLLFDDDTAKYFRRIKEFDKMYYKK